MPQRNYLLGAGVGCCTFGLLPPGAGALPGGVAAPAAAGAPPAANSAAVLTRYEFVGYFGLFSAASCATACIACSIGTRTTPLFLSTYP